MPVYYTPAILFKFFFICEKERRPISCRVKSKLKIIWPLSVKVLWLFLYETPRIMIFFLFCFLLYIHTIYVNIIYIKIKSEYICIYGINNIIKDHTKNLFIIMCILYLNSFYYEICVDTRYHPRNSITMLF